jgi:hypothetical protein
MPLHLNFWDSYEFSKSCSLLYYANQHNNNTRKSLQNFSFVKFIDSSIHICIDIHRRCYPAVYVLWLPSYLWWLQSTYSDAKRLSVDDDTKLVQYNYSDYYFASVARCKFTYLDPKVANFSMRSSYCSQMCWWSILHVACDMTCGMTGWNPIDVTSKCM